MNLSLGDARLAAALAHWDDLRAFVREPKNFPGYKVVRQYQVGGIEQPDGTHGKVVRLSRARTRKIDVARLSR